MILKTQQELVAIGGQPGTINNVGENSDKNSKM
jgi:hypothetical protein